MIQASSSVAQSTPETPGMSFRAGFTMKSVSATTNWPAGLRNGARKSCMKKRSSRA